VPDGIVRLDPRVSGVGPLAPLPLARSQYDVAVRLSEMDEVGVERHAVSLPPFLFCSTADDEAFATGIVGAATTSSPSTWRTIPHG
jgi:aminocarboxymuconate-semialdehyde decarboxylase